MNSLTRETFPLLFNEFKKTNNLQSRQIGQAIGCSKATVDRLMASETLPSDEMLKQGGVLMELGIKRYSKLTASERENLSEAIGTVGGGAVGFGSITAAVGSLGSVAGLSGAGIS